MGQELVALCCDAQMRCWEARFGVIFGLHTTYKTRHAIQLKKARGQRAIYGTLCVI